MPLLEAVEDGDFGPMSLGEACLDCMGAMFAPDGRNALRQIVMDKQIVMHARANALVTFYGGRWNALAPQVVPAPSNNNADEALVAWREYDEPEPTV